MATYEYGRIQRLADNLTKAKVAPEVAERILEGGEKVGGKASGEARADWMRNAMARMDQLLDAETRHKVREGCACCLGGKRQEISKGIAKAHESLEDRIAAANQARFVFGHSVSRTEDGRVLVCFSPEGEESYRCVCLPKAQEPISVTYCYCCGGHVKHHLQNALGRKLKLTVRSSALESGGKCPCTFLFDLLGAE